MRLVGRTTEQLVLRTVVDEARAGQLRIVVLTGEAGVGKTRLAEHVVTVATGQGFRTARGYGADGAPPRWPWQQVLRALGTDPPPDGPDEFATTTAYAQTVLDRTADEPLLILLDDLHRADPATAAVLSHLVDLAPALPLLLVVAHREPDGGDGRGLPQPLQGPAVRRFHLPGMSTPEVKALLEEALGRAVPTLVATQLRQRTGGNPGLLLAVAPQVDPAASGHERLTIRWPQTERSEAERQLARLSESARAALAAAAVIGREFDLAILEQVLAGGR